MGKEQLAGETKAGFQCFVVFSSELLWKILNNGDIYIYMYLCMGVLFFLVLLGLRLRHTQVPRLGVKSEQ